MENDSITSSHPLLARHIHNATTKDGTIDYPTLFASLSKEFESFEEAGQANQRAMRQMSLEMTLKNQELLEHKLNLEELVDHRTKELTEAKHKLELILDSVKEGIYLLDTKGKTIFANKAALEISGYQREEMVGVMQHPLIHHTKPDGTPYPRHECFIYKAFSEGITSTVDNEVFWHKNGHSFPVEYTATPFYDSEGVIVGAVTSFRNISERKQAEDNIKKERDFTQAIIDAIPEPIFVKDANHVWKAGNKSFWRLMGSTPEKFLNKNDHDLFQPEETEIFLDRDNYVINSGNIDVNEENITWANGKTIIALTTKSPLTLSNGERGLVGVIHDITDRKYAEEQLQHFNERLKKMVDERTQSLQVAKEEAERANRRKSEFLANITHELKTPVHCILNFAQIGVVNSDKNNPAQLKEHFDDIFVNGQRLDQRISDLLDISKAEGHRSEFGLGFRMDMHPIRALVENAIMLTSGIADKKCLKIRLEEGSWEHYVLVDSQRITQVLINLMSNAIRFTPDNGNIIWRAFTTTTTICESQINSPALCVTIWNEGPPIPQDELETIFDAFVQGKEAMSRGGGTGLGLAICRRFLQTFHGSIRAVEAKGGAQLEIVLPLWHKVTFSN